MPRGRWSRQQLYAHLDDLIADLTARFGGLPSPSEAEFVWNDIWHLEAHHSTALEGNTLVLREVATLLEQDRPVGAKPLKEYMEVRGYGAAATWVYQQASDGSERGDRPLITMQEVRHIHHLVMEQVWGVAPHPDATPAEAPGSFRQHDLHPFSAGMKPPIWTLVPARMDAWISSCNSTTPSDEPLTEQIARIHNEFEQIHPFIDGNGRTGRLAMNLLLVRLGYPPVIILKQNRNRYLVAMQKADAGDMGPLGEVLARAMIDNLNRFILPGVAGPARLVPLAALAGPDVSLAALRQAARRGRLTAERRDDGTWLSTAKAVEEYLNSRRSKIG